MTDATTAFFDGLSERGHEPLLEKVTGTLRFDLGNRRQTHYWLVTIVKGDIAVSEKNAPADCTVQMDEALFDGIASGNENALAALLRGAVGIDGDIELLMLFDRLFPGPPGARGPRYLTKSEGRRS
jgi:putative sterol carrier protein